MVSTPDFFKHKHIGTNKNYAQEWKLSVLTELQGKMNQGNAKKPSSEWNGERIYESEQQIQIRLDQPQGKIKKCETLMENGRHGDQQRKKVSSRTSALLRLSGGAVRSRFQG